MELIGLANRHPRVDILNPGIGVGGHCIAIDPLFVASMFPKDTVMIQSARAVNRKKTAWVIDRVLQEVEHYEKLHGKRACVAARKPLLLGYNPALDAQEGADGAP